MNSIIRLAIKEAYGSNPDNAIGIKYNSVLCPHIPDYPMYTDDCEIPTMTEIDTRKVDLNKYILNGSVAFIGECPKCLKVYYRE